MIYTVSFNPALDYVVFVDDFSLHKMNKIRREQLQLGGKAVNVSIVLSRLHIPTTVLGFVAGFTGGLIENMLTEEGVATDFVHEEGMSRINIKLKYDGETEMDAKGPDISDKALSELFMRLGSIKDGDMLVLAGTVPDCLPRNIYEQILEYVSAKKIQTVVVAHKDLLISCLPYKPFLIKPNLDELADIFGDRPTTREEVAAYAESLRDMGAKNVLVSMADKGAMLICEDGKTYYCEACKGKVINSVGAGDSLLAGFIAGTIDKDVNYDYALMLGNAAGAATAFSDGLGDESTIMQMMVEQLGKHGKQS